MLIYSRRGNSEQEWRDADGFLILWKGATSWYCAIGPDRSVKRLCDKSWPDGDAIAMYRANLKAQQIREATQ